MVFLTTVVRDLPASTQMVVLPQCLTVRSTRCVTTGLPTSLLRACLVPSGFHTISTRDLSCHKPGSHNLTLHVFLVPGCVAMLALHHDRHKISLPWPQQQTPTASQNSLDYYVARHFRAPSRRMCCFLSPSIPARCSLVFRTLADFLTTVFMLTCCTSESHKTQKSLAVSHVLQTTHKITVSCLVRHTSNCSNGNSPLRVWKVRFRPPTLHTGWSSSDKHNTTTKRKTQQRVAQRGKNGAELSHVHTVYQHSSHTRYRERWRAVLHATFHLLSNSSKIPNFLKLSNLSDFSNFLFHCHSFDCVWNVLNNEKGAITTAYESGKAI